MLIVSKVFILFFNTLSACGGLVYCILQEAKLSLQKEAIFIY